jgi:hypothetical protein
MVTWLKLGLESVMGVVGVAVTPAELASGVNMSKLVFAAWAWLAHANATASDSFLIVIFNPFELGKS